MKLREIYDVKSNIFYILGAIGLAIMSVVVIGELYIFEYGESKSNYIRMLLGYAFLIWIIIMIVFIVTNVIWNRKTLFEMNLQLPNDEKFEEFMIHVDHDMSSREYILNNIDKIKAINGKNPSTIKNIKKWIDQNVVAIIAIVFSLICSDVIVNSENIDELMKEIMGFIMFVALIALLIGIAVDFSRLNLSINFKRKIKFTSMWYEMYIAGATMYNKQHTPHYKIIKSVKHLDKELYYANIMTNGTDDTNGTMEKIENVVRNKEKELTFEETQMLVKVFSNFELKIRDFWDDTDYVAKLKQESNK